MICNNNSNFKKRAKNNVFIKTHKKEQIFKKKGKNFIFLHKVSLLRNLKIFSLINTRIRRKKNIYMNESINKSLVLIIYKIKRK